ncbi:MAG TPA: hypothetical protein DC057_17295 [Spirochaetia bacterium]|nr:hypothetical protein [Spirochaetia bacterium]
MSLKFLCKKCGNVNYLSVNKSENKYRCKNCNTIDFIPTNFFKINSLPEGIETSEYNSPFNTIYISSYFLLVIGFLMPFLLPKFFEIQKPDVYICQTICGFYWILFLISILKILSIKNIEHSIEKPSQLLFFKVVLIIGITSVIFSIALIAGYFNIDIKIQALSPIWLGYSCFFTIIAGMIIKRLSSNIVLCKEN